MELAAWWRSCAAYAPNRRGFIRLRSACAAAPAARDRPRSHPLDDVEAVAVRVAEREHRRDARVAQDLRVHVRAGGLQRGMVCLGVGGVEPDAGIDPRRRLAERREGDRRAAADRADLHPALTGSEWRVN